MAGVSELNSLKPSYIMADTHAALAEDAQVIVTDKERAILAKGQFLGDIGQKIF
jgi:hypothetical protein